MPPAEGAATVASGDSGGALEGELMKKLLAAFVLAFSLAGCGGIESSLKDGLKKELAENPLCLRLGSRPYIAYGTNDWKYGLLGNGMFASMPQSGGAFEMVPTKKAEKMIEDGKLCYGRTELVKIVDYTKPADTPLGRTVMVEARVRYVVTEKWARNELLSSVVKSGEETITRGFVEKKSGWQPL